MVEAEKGIHTRIAIEGNRETRNNRQLNFIFSESKQIETAQHMRDLSFSILYKDLFENPAKITKSVSSGHNSNKKKLVETKFHKELLP